MKRLLERRRTFRQQLAFNLTVSAVLMAYVAAASLLGDLLTSAAGTGSFAGWRFFTGRS